MALCDLRQFLATLDDFGRLKATLGPRVGLEITISLNDVSGLRSFVKTLFKLYSLKVKNSLVTYTPPLIV